MFAPVTSGRVVSGTGDFAQPVWGDYDRDGDLDLFISNASGNNRLFRNDGTGGFTEIVSGPVVTDGGTSEGAAWADFDGDGDLDLAVVNQAAENDFLYLGDGVGGFTRVVTGPVVNDGSKGSGLSWGDYDNDGDLDLAVGTLEQGTRIYRNDGAGNFTFLDQATPIRDTPHTYTVAWGDYDNDGDLDLFVGNYVGTNLLYRNDGTNGFSRVTTGPLVNTAGYSTGVAWADPDRDGDLDLYVASPWGNGNERYFRNSGSGGAWLEVGLVSGSGEQGGIGAKVRALATIKGKAVWQMRQVGCDVGFAQQSVTPVHFGLGDATNVTELRIDWPSGAVQTLANVAPRQFLTLYEHPPQWPLIAVQPPEAITAAAGSNLVIQAWVVGQPPLSFFWYRNATNLVSIGTNATLVVSNAVPLYSGAYTLVVGNVFGTVTSRVAQVSVEWQTRFLQVTNGPIAAEGYSEQGAWADYDRDGLPDLAVANGSPGGDPTGGDEFLYHNLGSGRFEKINLGPVVSSDGNSQGLAWGDYDDDGFPDLFVSNFTTNSFLFHNRGDGTFERVQAGSLTMNIGSSMGVCWGDYDRDRRLDLFVGNYFGEDDFLYHKEGSGSFLQVTNSPVANDGGASAAANWVDYDGDGWLDLFVANYALAQPGDKCALFHNERNGTFAKVTTGELVTGNQVCFTSAWGDYDNDGDPDLVVVPGTATDPNAFWRNDGNGTFTRITAGPIPNNPPSAACHAASWADIDNDGDLDLFVATGWGPRNFVLGLCTLLK